MRHKCDGVHGVAADLASNDVLDQWLLRNVSTMHHICSTCKMGPESDALAVVDQYGRVHGLAGLLVVDASILPDCPRANTNVVTMMLGEHIADGIRLGLEALVMYLSRLCLSTPFGCGGVCLGCNTGATWR